MTVKQYEDRKRSLEKMKELHKDDPYVLSYIIDIEKNWEDALRAATNNSNRRSPLSIIGKPRYYYDDISDQRKNLYGTY